MKLLPEIALSAKSARFRVFLLISLIPQIAISGAGISPAWIVSSGRECQKLVLTGEVTEGQARETEIGQDWIFRVLPITASGELLRLGIRMTPEEIKGEQAKCPE